MPKPERDDPDRIPAGRPDVVSDLPRHFVVVGLMGSGKTTIAGALARRLRRPLVDSDAQLVAREGRSAAEIASGEGLDRLHDLEAQLLLDALAEPAKSVIAAAASTIERQDCRTALRQEGVAVVWLRGHPEVLAERAAGGSHRPQLASTGDPAHPLATRRGHFYATVADVAVDVDDADPEAVLERLAQSLIKGR